MVFHTDHTQPASTTHAPGNAIEDPARWTSPADKLDGAPELGYITYSFYYIQEETMAIAVYSTPSCSYCRMVKDWLKQRNVRFDEYNVASDQRRAEEMVRKSGQMGVPVTDINGRIIIGFNTTELERALK
jgi:glutaredoxin-like YruB-family protein